MQTFHYHPPAPEEQRGFVMQFLGTLLGLVLIAVLWWWTTEMVVRGVLIGAGLATILRLGQAAWQLEKKAQRSQNGEIGVDDDGLHITDSAGQTQLIKWQDITKCHVINSRLTVEWEKGQIAIGAREMQDGMTLVREVTSRWARHTKGEDVSDHQPPAPSNFIPLMPK